MNHGCRKCGVAMRAVWLGGDILTLVAGPHLWACMEPACEWFGVAVVAGVPPQGEGKDAETTEGRAAAGDRVPSVR